MPNLDAPGAPYYDDHADWSLIPAHMAGGVYRYVMHGARPGDFLYALFSGAGLTEVVSRADHENRAALLGWARFLYNHVPAHCKGTPAHVAAWIERGGVLGGA